MFKALDDRIGHWVTLNEPWVITDGGYLHGVLAPGHRSRFEAPIASHHLMRAHGRAVQAYRAGSNRQRIGLVVNIEPKHPATASPDDARACVRAHAYMNEQYLDAALLGRYPPALRDEVFGEAWPDWPAGDMIQIRQPLDFVGINYYTRGVTRHDASAWPTFASPVRQPRSTYTETGWEVYPAALTETLLWFKQRYGELPLYVTENGAAFFDPPTVDGDVLDDPLRVRYIRDHLGAVHEAIRHGVDVRGYFAWSLLDNLEWALGYSKRFGLVHVDFQTQKRTPKRSARFYAQVIASNGAALAAG
jgi:beta-glucosidase